jgi:hypothetical protein
MTDWNSMDNAYAGRRGLLYGTMTDAFSKVAEPDSSGAYTDFDVCARAQLMYAGNDSEMPGAANYGVTSPNTELVYKALNSNIVDANGDSYMRLGDLQRNAINILNVILDTKIFQTDIYSKLSSYNELKKAGTASTTIAELQKELDQAKADLKAADADKTTLNKKIKTLQNKISTLNFSAKKVTVKSAKSTAKKTLKVTLKSISGAEKYQITYATNKNFKNSKTVTTKKTSVTIKKLKSKKTYYVKVRAVKTIGGKTVKSSYGAVKKVTVK